MTWRLRYRFRRRRQQRQKAERQYSTQKLIRALIEAEMAYLTTSANSWPASALGSIYGEFGAVIGLRARIEI